MGQNLVLCFLTKLASYNSFDTDSFWFGFCKDNWYYFQNGMTIILNSQLSSNLWTKCNSSNFQGIREQLKTETTWVTITFLVALNNQSSLSNFFSILTVFYWFKIGFLSQCWTNEKFVLFLTAQTEKTSWKKMGKTRLVVWWFGGLMLRIRWFKTCSNR